MTPSDRLGQITELARRFNSLGIQIKTGRIDPKAGLMKKVETQDAITEHLAALDSEGWLEWCAGELESANLVSSTYGAGMLD